MDPYIEWPPIWPDFHDALITYIRGELQPQLRPKYAALMRDRLYVMESQRPIFPDVSVVAPLSRHSPSNGAAALMELEEPIIFETMEEEIREPYLEIIEPRAGNRLITAVEVLSPTNKVPGPGREEYLQKRAEVRAAGAGLVEIDLLGDRNPMLPLSAEDLAKLPPWRYLVGVSRPPKRQAVYPIVMHKSLPKIRVPLANGDPDVILDLQAAFALAWEKGPYPMLLNYDGPPPGQMTDDEIAWCQQQLRQAGLRPQATS
jgi:Protein of unknown function (DUF4058)